MEGPTLADRISDVGRVPRSGPAGLPLDEALPIARQIADALEAAHEQGIIHRDLKPANIKVRPDGTVKVLDFGLAKAMDNVGRVPQSGPAAEASMSPTITTPAMTQAGMILGTAAYMSPEQAKGRTVDKRSDIWAFGCVLYEMLTGRRAFHAEDVSETLATVLMKEPDWAALPATTPPTVSVVLRRCLQKDRKQRVRDIGDVSLALEGAFETAAPASPTGAPVVSRTGRRVAWAAALGIVSLAALGWGAFAYFRPAPPAAEAIRFFMSPPDAWNFQSLTDATGVSPVPMAVSPDGRRMAFVAVGAGNSALLWIRSLDTLTAQSLAGTDGASSPFWSPDSRSLGFFAGGKLKKIDVAGGPPITLCDAPSSRGGSWSRDGIIVFNPANAVALQKVPAAGGTPTAATVLVADETAHRRPFFLPDGRHFLYSAASGAQTAGLSIYVASLDSADRKLLLTADANNALYSQGHLLFLRETTLMAQPFDAQRLELAGEPFPIAEQIQLSQTVPPNGFFSASEHGVLAYQTGTGAAGSQLVWFDRSGKELGVLGEPAAYSDIELSPDGKQASVSVPEQSGRARDVWLYDVARGLKTRLTFDAADELALIWSPDGSRAVFNSRRNGQLDLYQKAADGSGTEDVLLEDNRQKTPVSWSADGRFILYRSGGGPTGNDLFVLPLSGDRKPIPFVNTQFGEVTGAFSPDGRWVAYVSNESGRNEVYVAPFPGPGGKRQVSTGGGTQPRWRRDGMEMFYFTPDNTLMAAAVDGRGASFEAGEVKPLFETRRTGARSQYAVSTDGQRFLINTASEQAASAPIAVVVNWTAGLTDAPRAGSR